MHDQLNQDERDNVMETFAKGISPILISNDAASRGIDISGLHAVVNFTLPPDQFTYIHRIGRTGRIGNPGTAVTFLRNTDTRNFQVLAAIRQFLIEQGEEVSPLLDRLLGHSAPPHPPPVGPKPSDSRTNYLFSRQQRNSAYSSSHSSYTSNVSSQSVSHSSSSSFSHRSHTYHQTDLGIQPTHAPFGQSAPYPQSSGRYPSHNRPPSTSRTSNYGSRNQQNYGTQHRPQSGFGTSADARRTSSSASTRSSSRRRTSNRDQTSMEHPAPLNPYPNLPPPPPPRSHFH